LEDPLAEEIISGVLQKEGVVKISVKDDRLVFTQSNVVKNAHK
jgi:ATP-dependent Clp protease ATP-binding subunit ClpA